MPLGVQIDLTATDAMEQIRHNIELLWKEQERLSGATGAVKFNSPVDFRFKKTIGGISALPKAHDAYHQDGGDDEIDVTGLSGLLADPQTAKAKGADTEMQFNDGSLLGGAPNVRYDKATDTLRLGGESDYTEIEADGTIKCAGDATTFNDINISGLALGTGPAAPSIISLNSTGVLAYAFIGTGVLADELHGSIEALHDYLEGSDIVPHVHWCPTTNDAGDVKWQLEYIWISRTGTITGSTTIDVTTAAGGTAWVLKRSDFPAVSGANRQIGDRFMFRIFRDPADLADTYGFDAAILDVGIHYQKDTMGSRGVTTK